MITFAPKQDITAYEASLVAFALVNPEYVLGLPENVKRHFIIKDEPPKPNVFQRIWKMIETDC